MTMFQPSPQSSLFPTLDECPPSSSEARPAKTPARQIAVAKESMASGRVSSLKRPASSVNADLVGALLRTVLSSELAAMTGSPTSWKNSGTPANRSWWQLVMLVPRTAGSGSGSLLPTPAKQSQSGGLRLEGGSGERKKLRQMMGSPRANKWGEPDCHGRTIGINGAEALHATYEWVMGYPPRWLARASAHTVTPSSPKSRKPSGDQFSASKPRADTSPL